jgi:hypothetical protein
MKIVVNSAYGYLGAGGLTRFADVHAANEVTRHGRDLLAFICRELAARGVTLLEADTDGVYFAVPDTGWDEAGERRVVAEVAALLPARVQLEYDGRFAAMLSHEPKNYALRRYDGRLVLRGVAFRSSRSERFGQSFLRQAIACLFDGDVAAARAAFVAAVGRLRRREVPTRDVTTVARLTKTPEEYLATRADRRELAYEALLASGRTTWAAGDRVRVYRASGGGRSWSTKPRTMTAPSTIRATTTSSTTCGSCATPTPPGWRARSRPRTTPPWSRRPSSSRSSRTIWAPPGPSSRSSPIQSPLHSNDDERAVVGGHPFPGGGGRALVWIPVGRAGRIGRRSIVLPTTSRAASAR